MLWMAHQAVDRLPLTCSVCTQIKIGSISNDIQTFCVNWSTRFKNSVRIQESIRAKILLNKVMRIPSRFLQYVSFWKKKQQQQQTSKQKQQQQTLNEWRRIRRSKWICAAFLNFWPCQLKIFKSWLFYIESKKSWIDKNVEAQFHYRHYILTHNCTL